MTNQSIIPTVLCTLLLGGLTACSSPKPSVSQSSASPSPVAVQPSPSGMAQTTAGQAKEKSHWTEKIHQQLQPILTQDQAKLLDTKLQQGEKMHQALSELNLTNDQHQKVEEILRADAAQAKANHAEERARWVEKIRKQLEPILTPDQAKLLDTELQQGKKIHQALGALNLTPDQHQKVDDILKADHLERRSLTPSAP